MRLSAVALVVGVPTFAFAAEPTPTQPAAPAVEPTQPAPSPEQPKTPAQPAETFTVIQAPAGEAPPLPFPVVLSLGSAFTPRLGLGDFYVEPHLRVRLKFVYVQEDPNRFSIGRTNGFQLGQARAGITGGYRRIVRYNLQFEGAVDRRSTQNQLVGELHTRLRDANFTFSPYDFVQLTAGQFRPPTNRETLSGVDAAVGSGRTAVTQLLPEMSVANRGIPPEEGQQTASMDPGRELGVMMHGDIEPAWFFTTTYAFALVNGNGQNESLNDNNEPTAYARFTTGVHDLPVLTMLDVGISLHFGRNAIMVLPPNVFHEQALGGALDAVVQLLGFQVWAQLQWEQTRHLTTQLPTELALGGFLQVAWRDLFGFSPAARLAYYQSSSALPQLTVAELTVGARYDMPGLPLSLWFGFTHPEETGWGVYNLGPENVTRETSVPDALRVPSGLRDSLGIKNWAPDRVDTLSISNDRVELVLQMSF